MEKVIKFNDSSKILFVDSVPVQVLAPDLNGDGIVGGVETVSSRGMVEMPVAVTSELGEALRELNRDSSPEGSIVSDIDLRSRLDKYCIAPLTAVESLVRLNVYPMAALDFTIQWKRNWVSEDGKGRGEFVQVTQGLKGAEDKKNLSVIDKIKALWSNKK